MRWEVACAEDQSSPYFAYLRDGWEPFAVVREQHPVTLYVFIYIYFRRQVKVSA